VAVAVSLLSTEEAKKPLPLPVSCTVKDALLWYCDINHLCRTALLKTLTQYAKDPAEKERMLKCCTEGKEQFLSDKYSLMEVLHMFPSVTPPFDHFLELCPKLTPRFYTISSSVKVDKTRIAITVSLALTDLNNKRRHVGKRTHG
jgi:sulfite reductase alpha subunit-like flavoprotein